jgi:hypothetical protein
VGEWVSGGSTASHSPCPTTVPPRVRVGWSDHAGGSTQSQTVARLPRSTVASFGAAPRAPCTRRTERRVEHASTTTTARRKSYHFDILCGDSCGKGEDANHARGIYHKQHDGGSLLCLAIPSHRDPTASVWLCVRACVCVRVTGRSGHWGDAAQERGKEGWWRWRASLTGHETETETATDSPLIHQGVEPTVGVVLRIECCGLQRANKGGSQRGISVPAHPTSRAGGVSAYHDEKIVSAANV